MEIKSPNTINSLRIGRDLKEYFVRYLKGDVYLPEETPTPKRTISLYAISPDFSSSQISANVPTPQKMKERTNDFEFKIAYGDSLIDLNGRKNERDTNPEFAYNISTNIDRHRSGETFFPYWTAKSNMIFNSREEYQAFRELMDHFHSYIEIRDPNKSELNYQGHRIIIDYPGYFSGSKPIDFESKVNMIWKAAKVGKAFLKNSECELVRAAEIKAQDFLKNFNFK